MMSTDNNNKNKKHNKILTTKKNKIKFQTKTKTKIPVSTAEQNVSKSLMNQVIFNYIKYNKNIIIYNFKDQTL